MIINDLILRIINTFNFVHCTQVLVRGFYIKRVVYIVSIDALGKYYIKGRTSLRGPYLHMSLGDYAQFRCGYIGA